MPEAGVVYLVGAGPGDPGLITVRGLDVLRNADVVLHDRLVPESLLAEARSDATMINVGKTPGEANLSQWEINELLVDHCRSGKTVCRLKGGDPFVFGRGGEEAMALAAAGLKWEVVPGRHVRHRRPSLRRYPGNSPGRLVGSGRRYGE